jgi:hypothetical protein
VKLAALKLFDEKTIVGVNHFDSQAAIDVSGTAKFLHIILHTWNMLNIRSTDKSRHERDCNQDPIRSVIDDNAAFLQNVHSWHVKWKALNVKVQQGRLPNETLLGI